MHISYLLIAGAPALVASQQIPIIDRIKSFFAPASATLQSAASAVTNLATAIPDPVDLAAEAAGAAAITNLEFETFSQLPHRSSSPGTQQWLILATGGNKTCAGRCARVDKAFTHAAAKLALSPSAPHLGKVDCEQQGVLCGSWALTPPAIMYLDLPHPAHDQSQPSNTVRFIRVNATAITSDEVVALHEDKGYESTKPYEGIWHPFDGAIAKNGLAQPVGYVVSQASRIPSWTWMVAISMLTRTFGSRRMRQQPGANAPRPAAPPK